MGQDGVANFPAYLVLTAHSSRTSAFSLPRDVVAIYFNYITSDELPQYCNTQDEDYAWAQLRSTDGTVIVTLFTARTTPSGDTSPGVRPPPIDPSIKLTSTFNLVTLLQITAVRPSWFPLSVSDF